MLSLYEKACEFLSGEEDSAMCPDGFEEAVIGVTHLWNKGYVFALSTHKCMEILIARDGVSIEEAEEYFSFNVTGAYVGDKTPIFVDDLRDD